MNELSDEIDTELSPNKQQLLKRNSLFGDELLNFDSAEFDDGDNWRDVFDEDDDPANKEDSPSQNNVNTAELAGISEDDLKSVSDHDNAETISMSNNASLDHDDTSVRGSSLIGEKDDDGRKQGSQISRDWHSTKVDMPYREKMERDIAQLLLARKKQKMTDAKWVARVKAQARAFEAQLYRNADSLEGYRDVTTLKKRIARLANAFASHFKKAKGEKGSSSRRSISSISTTGSLEKHFSNADLRRSSLASMASTATNRSSQSQGFRDDSLSASALNPDPILGNLVRTQGGNTFNSSLRRSSGGSMTNESINGGSSMVGNLEPNGLGLAQQFQPNNTQQQQLQQQLLQMQQQMALVKQLGITQGANNNVAGQVAMMGNGNSLMMLNQLQQQSMMNARNLNMAQQRNLMNQHQQQNAMGLGNNVIQTSNSGMLMGNNTMNMNLQSVLPTGNILGINMGNGAMNRRDSAMMPPPGMLNGQGENQSQSSNNNSTPSGGAFNW